VGAKPYLERLDAALARSGATPLPARTARSATIPEVALSE